MGHRIPYLILVKTMISLILQPCSRLGTKNPYPIPDKLFSMQSPDCYHSPTCTPSKPTSYKVTSQFQFLIIDKILGICTGHLPGKLHPILDQNCLISITYPRLNCLKTIPLPSSTYLYSLYMGVHPPGYANIQTCAVWSCIPKLNKSLKFSTFQFIVKVYLHRGHLWHCWSLQFTGCPVSLSLVNGLTHHNKSPHIVAQWLWCAWPTFRMSIHIVDEDFLLCPTLSLLFITRQTYHLSRTKIIYWKTTSLFQTLLYDWENYFIVIGWEQANLSLILNSQCVAN